MYAIRTASGSDQPAVVELIARLQAEPEHHIGFHGETAEEIAAELAGFRPDWASGAALATDPSGRVRGVLSVEADAGTGRAWLYGPFVDVPSHHPAAGPLWQSTADGLLGQVCRTPRLARAARLDLFGHRQHRMLADFAARHGFATGAVSRVFLLDGDALRATLVRATDSESTVDDRVYLLEDDPALRAAVSRLHERCFPDAPVSGAGLVGGADARAAHCVVTLRDSEGLVGYAAGVAQEAELYVDLVAVDPNRRSAGAGRALVRGLLRELAARHGARGQAAATITLGNDASERMFTALGFELHLELVGYRRQ